MVAAASGRVNRLGGSLTEAEMRAVLELAGWPEELVEEALRVSWCESRRSPYGTGDRGQSLGLFQLWRGWAAWYGVAEDELYDPVTNARVALAVRQHRARWGGAGGWTCADRLGIR